MLWITVQTILWFLKDFWKYFGINFPKNVFRKCGLIIFFKDLIMNHLEVTGGSQASGTQQKLEHDIYTGRFIQAKCSYNWPGKTQTYLITKFGVEELFSTCGL